VALAEGRELLEASLNIVGSIVVGLVAAAAGLATALL
jgi:fluoride ion exporter CrcB/FEX